MRSAWSAEGTTDNPALCTSKAINLLIKKGRELLYIKHNGILTTKGIDKKDKQTNISKHIQVQNTDPKT